MEQTFALGILENSGSAQPCASSFSTRSRIHDTTQFESRFDFQLPQLGSDVSSSSYQVELFLFFPSHLNINESTYPVESFYGDLTHLLRVRTPRPANQLTPQLESSSPTGREVRLFGCRMFSLLQHLQDQWELVKGRCCTSASSSSEPDCEQVAQFSVDLESAHKELRNFRGRYLWSEDAASKIHGFEADVRQAILLVDELLSYHFEQVIIQILRDPPDRSEVAQLLQNQLEAVLVGELAYRGQHIAPRTGIASELSKDIRTEELALNHERLSYRLGVVKRFIFAILFVEGRRHRRDYLYRNVAAGVGAALAALFATIANIQIINMQMNRDEGYYKVFLVMLLGTVAYVFKDRIKENTKDFIFSRIGHRLPDYERHLHYKLTDSAGQVTRCRLGTSREFARYLDRETIPADIIAVRNQGHRTDLDPDRSEDVLHYDKQIEFLPDKLQAKELEEASIHSLIDILRLNVSKFLVKLHDPTQSKFFFDLQTGIHQVEMPRVYHLNIVCRHTCILNGTTRVQYERLRLILNKTGIQRLEVVGQLESGS